MFSSFSHFLIESNAIDLTGLKNVCFRSATILLGCISGDTLKTPHCSDYEAQNDIQGEKGNVTTLILLSILKGIGIGFGSILETRAGYMSWEGRLTEIPEACERDLEGNWELEKSQASNRSHRSLHSRVSCTLFLTKRLLRRQGSQQVC